MTRVAIIHDVFIELGGAERVLMALIDMYPHADVYVPLLGPSGRTILRKRSKGRVYSSWLNHIPFLSPASLLMKPLLCWYWEQLNLSQYQVVISSSHSYSSKSVITGPGTLHISYIHTPPHYLYTEFNDVNLLRNPLLRIAVAPLMSWLRVKDFIGAQRPDVLVANSKTVQARIKKYYRRDSMVIYPPVRIPESLPHRAPEYFVCVSRLAEQKGIVLAILACNKLREKLVVVGQGAQERYLQSIAGPTIEFLGRIPDENLTEIWAGAKALIYPAIDEDFGIVPVEAMASGVPVIGYNSGGTSETVQDGKTGILFSDRTEAGMRAAIIRFYASNLLVRPVRADLHKYHVKTFQNSMKRIIVS